MRSAARQPSPVQSPWLGTAPTVRAERHFNGRVVRCFADRPKSTFALLTRAVSTNPDGEAIVCGEERLTYRHFERIVNGWATRLEELGVGRGDRVAILLGNGTAFPAVLLATQRIGAIAVPIGIREQTPGLAYMLAHCGAKVLVHEADLAGRLPAPSVTPQLRHRLALSPDAPNGGLERVDSNNRMAAPPADVDEEDTAVILYTSGTTGQPKGAMLTSAIRPCTTSSAWGSPRATDLSSPCR